MLEKMQKLSLRAYTRVRSTVCCAVYDLKNLKDDELGLSGVVVAVLLILVAVLAIVLLWGSLKSWLGTTWDSITGKAKEIT